MALNPLFSIPGRKASTASEWAYRGLSRVMPLWIMCWVRFRRRNANSQQSMVEETCDALEFSLDHTFEQTMAKFNKS